MKIRLLVVLMGYLLAPVSLWGQALPNDDILLEPPGGLEDELEDGSPTIELIDLRRATVEQLCRLPGIMLRDALSIIELLATNRRAGFETIAELDGMTAEKLVILRTYCRVAPLPRPPERSPRVSIRSRIRSDLEPRRGYEEPLYRIIDSSTGSDTIAVARRYLGSPIAIVSAIDYDGGAISAHLLLAKDPGEPLIHFDTTRFGYQQYEHDSTGRFGSAVRRRAGPFLGGGLLWNSGGVSIAVGDYAVGAASGLALASRAEQRATSIPRSASTMLTLDRSAAEVSYLRGIAASISFDRFELLGFHSRRARDGGLDSVDIDGRSTEAVVSLRDGAARRTHSDMRRHGNLLETIIGSRLEWNGADARAGTTAYNVDYSIPVHPRYRELWRGRTAMVVSLDAGCRLGRVDLGAEVARSPGGAIGMTATAALRFDRSLLQFGLAEIPSAFSVPHGDRMSPFDRGDGRRISVALRSTLDDDFDLDLTASSTLAPERSEQRKNRCDLLIRYTAAHGIELRGRLGLHHSVERVSAVQDGRERYRLLEVGDHAAGAEATVTPKGTAFRLRTGILWRRSGTTSSAGHLTFAEIGHSIASSITVAGRFTFFDGEIPVYQFEQLLPGWPRSVALNGQGSRFWIRIGGEIGRMMRVAGFIARTAYFDRNLISEDSLDEISGDSSGMAGLQLDLRFEP